MHFFIFKSIRKIFSLISHQSPPLHIPRIAIISTRTHRTAYLFPLSNLKKYFFNHYKISFYVFNFCLFFFRLSYLVSLQFSLTIKIAFWIFLLLFLEEKPNEKKPAQQIHTWILHLKKIVLRNEIQINKKQIAKVFLQKICNLQNVFFHLANDLINFKFFYVFYNNIHLCV